MKLYALLLLTFLGVFCNAPQTEGSKFLATFGSPGRSQYIFMEAYLKALAAKGHEVTVISPFKQKPVTNMRFITADKINEYYDEMLEKVQCTGLWAQQFAFYWMLPTICECILDNENVQNLMKSGETFDVVLAEMMQSESLFGLAQHFNATLIGFSSYGNDHHIDEIMGNISPLSVNPLITSPRTNPMSFYERLENRLEFVIETLARWWIHLPNMEKQYSKYFPNAKLSLAEVVNSFRLILLGQHFSLSYARPYLPNMIEMGGSHINHKPKDLPKDIKQFIETAPNGVIYFSLGSNIKSKDLPLETRETLMKVLGRLKQRVLWKFEDDQLPNRPENVFISKWFPQPDILSHPNVKLFISHGGLLSTIESIYFGKPMLGLPVIYDQFLNIRRAESMGFGIGLDLQNLKELELEQTIKKLLETPSYTKAAQLMSERYRDQPEHPVERAVWWTEYVIRHKGAPHMQSPSRDISYLQLHGLDTLAVLVIVPLVGLYIVAKLLCWLIALVFGSKSKRHQKLKKH